MIDLRFPFFRNRFAKFFQFNAAVLRRIFTAFPDRASQSAIKAFYRPAQRKRVFLPRFIGIIAEPMRNFHIIFHGVGFDIIIELAGRHKVFFDSRSQPVIGTILYIFNELRIFRAEGIEI